MVLISNALANIKAYKLRVFVAMVWIVLGITSVVIVASVGTGLEAKIAEASEDADKRVVTLEYLASYSEMSKFLEPFSRENIEYISFIEGVEKIDTSGGDGKNNARIGTSILIDNNYYGCIVYPATIKDNTRVAHGRSFGYEDEERNVILLNYDNAISIFGSPESALGEFVDIDEFTFEVVGVLSQVKSNLMNSNEYIELETCFIPSKTFDKMHNSFNVQSMVGLDKVSVIVAPGYNLMEVGRNVADALNSKNGTESGSYVQSNNDEELRNLQQLQYYISEITTLLTFVSLFLGGIGIMNIMYIAVSERKREIGIRRAIGAKPKNILFQFLVESVVITSLGGIVGIICGIFTSMIVSKIMPFEIVPTMASYIYAVGASMIIGIIFGIVPAIKASRIDPIKAIQG